MATEQVIATVTSIVGSATVRDAEGTIRVLKTGDEILLGETVLTAPASVVTLDFVDGTQLVLPGNEETRITEDVARTTPPAPESAAVEGATVEEVIAALERGESLDDLLDDAAPGAGDPAGGGDSEGSSFVMITRIDSPVDPVSYDFGIFAASPPDLLFEGDPLEAEEVLVPEPAPEPAPEPEFSPPPPPPPPPPRRRRHRHRRPPRLPTMRW